MMSDLGVNDLSIVYAYIINFLAKKVNKIK